MCFLWDVPHRQVVFTIPKMLRVFFKYKRRLLGELCRAALRTLNRYFEVATGESLIPGVIAVIQTFGDRINFHPHLHFLVTEGGMDATGVFHEILRIDDVRLADLFAREVLATLVGKELLSPEWAERLLSWRHTGFNVHSLVRTQTKAEAERVGKYMIRPLVCLERLAFLEPKGQVGYRLGRDGEGLRAVEKERPVGPDGVRRYLDDKFGEALEDVLKAMRELAASFSPRDLNIKGFSLYERFRPSIPDGVHGWGAKGQLDIKRIRSLAKKAD
jgi:hypothetical protein